MDDLFGEVIHRYTRAQAIEDGILVDVTETAKEAGIKFPVAMTRTVWTKYVEVPEGVQCQDEAGRLWDILWMFTVALKANRTTTDGIIFRLHVRNDNCRPRIVPLKAMCGPGDDLEPVITIMLPDED